MGKIEKLAEVFDLKQKHISCVALPPTIDSVMRIQEHLGFKLPQSYILFAQQAKHYGNWLASIGEDYESETHIINLNDEWHGIASPEKRLPSNFVIFNVGYDEDFDCFDTETYDENTGEYLITYWYPGVDLRECGLHESFIASMQSHILGWSYT